MGLAGKDRFDCYSNWGNTHFSYRHLFYNQRSPAKKIVEQIKCNPGRRSVIFLVEIDGNIEGQVRNYCEQQPQLKGLELFKVSYQGRLQDNELDKFVVDVKSAINTMTACGTDKINLFYKGPIHAALILGAILANGCKVVLYHLDNQGEQLYVNCGPLKRDVV